METDLLFLMNSAAHMLMKMIFQFSFGIKKKNNT